jgi:uncharacterized membrane protein
MPQPDNVTPFRPRRAPPRPNPGNPLKSHRGKVLIVHGLTIAAFAVFAVADLFVRGSPLGFLGLAIAIAAVAIAASNRHEGMPWAMTHHEFALRTIVIGAVVSTLASLVSFIPGMATPAFWILVAVALWVLIRAAAGVVFAILRKPMPRPTGLLL